MPDWLQDWLGGVALAISTAIGAWLTGISSRVHRNAIKIAVLESKVDDMPKLLTEIRDEIKALRKESEERASKLYRHIEDMRREVKDDLDKKVNK